MRNKSFIVGACALVLSTSATFGALTSIHLGIILPLGDSISSGDIVGGMTPGAWRDPFYQDATAQGLTMQFVGDSSHNSTPLLDAAGQNMHSGHPGDEIFNDDPSTGRPIGVDTVWNVNDEQQGHLQPTWILLMAGTNDLVVGHTDTASRYAQMLADIHNADPTAHVICGSLPPCLALPAGTIDATNVQLEQVVSADHALGWDDTWADVGNSYTTADMLDPYHPNQQGDDLLAAAWLNAVESYGASPLPEPTSLGFLIIGGMLLRHRTTRRSPTNRQSRPTIAIA